MVGHIFLTEEKSVCSQSEIVVRDRRPMYRPKRATKIMPALDHSLVSFPVCNEA